MSEQEKIRILILGGGFAGLHAAIHLDDTLARDPDIEITLVNRDNFFLFTPMLHEVAASDLDLTNIVNPVRKLLKRVSFFAGEVESIDLDRKRVRVSHGFDHHHHELNYDHLVIDHELLQPAWLGRASTNHEIAGRCHPSSEPSDFSIGRSRYRV